MEKPEFNKRTVCFLEAIFCDPQLGESAGEEGTDTEEDGVDARAELCKLKIGQGIFQVYWKTSTFSLAQTAMCNSDMSLEHFHTHFLLHFFGLKIGTSHLLAANPEFVICFSRNRQWFRM